MKIDLSKLLQAAEVVGLSLAASYAQSQQTGTSMHSSDYQGAAFAAIPMALSAIVAEQTDPVPVSALMDGIKKASGVVTNALTAANQNGESLHQAQWTGLGIISGMTLIDSLAQSISTSSEIPPEIQAAQNG